MNCLVVAKVEQLIEKERSPYTVGKGIDTNHDIQYGGVDSEIKGHSNCTFIQIWGKHGI